MGVNIRCTPAYDVRALTGHSLIACSLLNVSSPIELLKSSSLEHSDLGHTLVPYGGVTGEAVSLRYSRTAGEPRPGFERHPVSIACLGKRRKPGLASQCAGALLPGPRALGMHCARDGSALWRSAGLVGSVLFFVHAANRNYSLELT